MGITKGKWSTLLTELLEFKRHYDANIPLVEALPSIARAGAAAYTGMGLRDLCDELHACYCENATARAMRRMYTRSEEHTSELQSLMRISYAVFCLKKKN